MEELMIVANVAIVFGVIYKLFELFVGRKERMMLIEKLPVEALTDEKKKKYRLVFIQSGRKYVSYVLVISSLGLSVDRTWIGIIDRILYYFKFSAGIFCQRYGQSSCP